MAGGFCTDSAYLRFIELDYAEVVGFDRAYPPTRERTSPVMILPSFNSISRDWPALAMTAEISRIKIMDGDMTNVFMTPPAIGNGPDQ
jgi:hypothetical protein